MRQILIRLAPATATLPAQAERTKPQGSKETDNATSRNVAAESVQRTKE